jgi:hypothetical protein
MITIVSPRGARSIDAEPVAGDGALWIGADDLDAATGWHLRPEGLCKDDVCIIVPDEMRREHTVDAAALWRRLDRPAIATASGDAWYLGEDASTRAGALAGGVAPDFRLRDLAGVEHALSDHRGKKVLLASWAPW